MCARLKAKVVTMLASGIDVMDSVFWSNWIGKKLLAAQTADARSSRLARMLRRKTGPSFKFRHRGTHHE